MGFGPPQATIGPVVAPRWARGTDFESCSVPFEFVRGVIGHVRTLRHDGRRERRRGIESAAYALAPGLLEAGTCFYARCSPESRGDWEAASSMPQRRSGSRILVSGEGAVF